MKRFKTYKAFAIFFSILMLLGVVGIVFTEIIDIAVIEGSMPWLVTFMHSIGINSVEQARHVIMIYVGVVYLLVFWFTCLAFKHARRALERVKNARAQSSQVYITTEEDVKKIKKQQQKKNSEGKKMKSLKERFAARAAKRAEKQAAKQAKKAAKHVAEEVQEVKEEKVEPAISKASSKIDSILDSMK